MPRHQSCTARHRCSLPLRQHRLPSKEALHQGTQNLSGDACIGGCSIKEHPVQGACRRPGQLQVAAGGGANRARRVAASAASVLLPQDGKELSQFQKNLQDLKALQQELQVAELKRGLIDQQVQHHAIHLRLLARRCPRLMGPLTAQRAAGYMASTLLVLLRIALPFVSLRLAHAALALRRFHESTDARLHIVLTRTEKDSRLTLNFDIPTLSGKGAEGEAMGMKVARLLALAVRFRTLPTCAITS